MNLLYVKAIHIIFVVCWFAGLFYIWRLFVNHQEANNLPEPNKSILQTQYKIMMKRLWYGITWPSAVIASIFGYWLLVEMYGWQALNQQWVVAKLLFVTLLFIYHAMAQVYLNQILNNTIQRSGNFFRFLNEIASVLLVAIVFIVVLKDTLSWVYGVLGLFVLIIVLMLAIKVYKRLRKN